MLAQHINSLSRVKTRTSPDMVLLFLCLEQTCSPLSSSPSPRQRRRQSHGQDKASPSSRPGIRSVASTFRFPLDDSLTSRAQSYHADILPPSAIPWSQLTHLDYFVAESPVAVNTPLVPLRGTEANMKAVIQGAHAHGVSVSIVGLRSHPRWPLADACAEHRRGHRLSHLFLPRRLGREQDRLCQQRRLVRPQVRL